MAQIESSVKISVICGKFIEVIIRVKPDFATAVTDWSRGESKMDYKSGEE